MAYERLTARVARQEANRAALPGILGQPCSPTWTFQDPGAGADYARARWAQAFKSPTISMGNLKLATGTKAFKIVCDGQTAVIHPDDAGWVVRAVEPFMTRIKPIWAQAAYDRELPGGTRVKAGLFPWLPAQWTCPECWPRLDQSTACIDSCSVQTIYGGRMDQLVSIFGYDNRAMRPWASNIDLMPECGSPGPGGPDTLCMPVEGFCRLTMQAKEYIQAFWQDVAQAITAYNANPPAKPTLAPKPAPVAAVAAVPPPKRDVNWLPLLAVGLGTGLLGVFLWNRS